MVVGGMLAAHLSFASGGPLELPGERAPDFLLNSSQGYLGVGLNEIDPDRAGALHLKDAHGAEVTMVDHDAPPTNPASTFTTSFFNWMVSPLTLPNNCASGFGICLPGADQVAGQPRREFDDDCHTTLRPKSSRSAGLVSPYDGSGPERTGGADEPRVCRASRIDEARDPRHRDPQIYVCGCDCESGYAQLAGYFGVRSGTGLLVEALIFKALRESRPGSRRCCGQSGLESDDSPQRLGQSHSQPPWPAGAGDRHAQQAGAGSGHERRKAEKALSVIQPLQIAAQAADPAHSFLVTRGAVWRCDSIEPMQQKHTLRGRTKAATRKLRELAVVGRALASTRHVVMAQIVPMRFWQSLLRVLQ